MTRIHDVSLGGEIVDLTITGATRNYTSQGLTSYSFPGPDGKLATIWLPEGAEAVTEVRRTPADGEPRPGDLWLDADGRRYFATDRATAGYTEIQLVPESGNGHMCQSWRAVHTGPRGPITLEHRPEPVKVDGAAAVIAATMETAGAEA